MKNALKQTAEKTMALLDKSNMIHKHFNKTDTAALKNSLLEARENDSLASSKEMFNYIDQVGKIAAALDW